MKTAIFKNNWLIAAGILLVLPTAYFILIGTLSEFGINGPLESIQPLAEKLGIKDPPGLNITSVILFGPMIAFLLTVFQFLRIEWHFSRDGFQIHLAFQKKWLPILVAAASVALLAVLFFYMLGENCNC